MDGASGHAVAALFHPAVLEVTHQMVVWYVCAIQGQVDQLAATRGAALKTPAEVCVDAADGAARVATHDGDTSCNNDALVDDNVGDGSGAAAQGAHTSCKKRRKRRRDM